MLALNIFPPMALSSNERPDITMQLALLRYDQQAAPSAAHAPISYFMTGETG